MYILWSKQAKRESNERYMPAQGGGMGIKMNIDIEKIKMKYENTSLNYLSFDISGISKKVVSDFSIPDDEKIIAHVFKKKLAFLLTEMIIITDKAIYTTKKISRHRETNRIVYETICSYVAYSEDSQLSCALLNQKEKIPVLEKTLGDILSSRGYGEELTEFIQLIQIQLVEDNKVALKQRENVVKWARDEANKALCNGDLINEKLYIIKELQKEPLFYKEMSILLGRNYVKNCNICNFLELISQISKKDDANDILKSISLDIDQFEKDSYNSEVNYSPYYIERIKGNIEKSISSEKDEIQNEIMKRYVTMLRNVQLPFEIRFNPFISDEDIIRKCSNSEERFNLLKFAKKIRNGLMLEVVCQIQEGKYDLDNKYLEYLDANGLNPLYYALLLKNEGAVDYFFKKIKKKNDISIRLIDTKYEKIFDYCFLAQYIGYFDIVKAMLDKEPEIAILRKSINAASALIKLKTVKLTVLQRAVSNAETTLRKYQHSEDVDYEKVEEAREKIIENKENITCIKEEIRDLERDIEDLEEEIQDSIRRYNKKFNVWTEEINQTDDVIYNAFKSILGDYDKIKSFLSLPEKDIELLEYNGMYILISKEIYAHYTKQDKIEYEEKKFNSEYVNQTEDGIKKTYITSWFSQEAHNNLGRLRNEYRILAKKYHPDVDSKYEKIFVEINMERAEILEKLGKTK